jgi:hypothetical protein
MSDGSRLPGRRGRLALAVILAAAAGSIYAGSRVATGDASSPNAVVPLRHAALPPTLREAIARAAKADGVDPSSVVKAAPAGAGAETFAALVGAGADGNPRISFFHGFGMTQFQPPGHLFLRGAEMAFSEGYSGPQHDPVRVGIVGATRASVEHVTIELVDGRVIEAPLVAVRGVQLFAYAGDTPDAFPAVVKAYGRDGALVQTHEIPRP